MMQRTTTETIQLTLEADKPQQVIGNFSAIKILSGGYHSYRVFDKDPGSGLSSAGLLQSRRLDLDGGLIIGPFENPYFSAVGQIPGSTTTPLKLLLYTGAVGFVETDESDRMHSENLEWFPVIGVNAGSERLIGSTGNAQQGVNDNDQELHARGWWDGWVGSDKSFHVEMRVNDTLSGQHVMCAAKSRDMGGGSHTLNIGMAAWDWAWQKSAPATFAAIALASRLPVAFATKTLLYYVDTSASAAIIASQVSIRSR